MFYLTTFNAKKHFIQLNPWLTQQHFEGLHGVFYVTVMQNGLYRFNIIPCCVHPGHAVHSSPILPLNKKLAPGEGKEALGDNHQGQESPGVVLAPKPAS